jgi:hypothetical protein
MAKKTPSSLLDLVQVEAPKSSSSKKSDKDLIEIENSLLSGEVVDKFHEAERLSKEWTAAHKAFKDTIKELMKDKIYPEKAKKDGRHQSSYLVKSKGSPKILMLQVKEGQSRCKVEDAERLNEVTGKEYFTFDTTLGLNTDYLENEEVIKTLMPLLKKYPDLLTKTKKSIPVTGFMDKAIKEGDLETVLNLTPPDFVLTGK